MSGVITHDPHDIGGRTRFGVAERFHPELTKLGFFDNMPVAEALELAKQVYRESYAKPLQLFGIKLQPIANALLSFAINEGVKTAIKILQQTLKVTSDGNFGPKTLAAVNEVDLKSFMANLKSLESEHYVLLVREKPSQLSFIQGWLNRVNQNCNV